MYDSFETRSKVFEKWVALTGFAGMGDHLEFYLISEILSRPSDLYKLGLRHLYFNREISEEEAHKILEVIEKTKSLSLARVLVCLLPDLSLTDVEGVVSSPCTFEELVERCENSEYAGVLLEELYRLSQLDIELSFGDDPIFAELRTTPFTDKLVAIAGKLSASDEIVTESLTSLGASVQNKIVKNIDYLIIGEGATTEKELAESLGVKVLTESDVAAMLGV